ncbi:MAG: hypothetical protein DRH50_09035 [Deltaproteobacteria bacterium]|nr:MAG: hypothetical protein DRH50_09035 [Deltaproteobacteria bacterium]
MLSHYIDVVLNRHGRIQNILATHGYENTDWFFNMFFCVFMVKVNYFQKSQPLWPYQIDACYASTTFL